MKRFILTKTTKDFIFVFKSHIGQIKIKKV